MRAGAWVCVQMEFGYFQGWTLPSPLWASQTFEQFKCIFLIMQFNGAVLLDNRQFSKSVFK